jgi:hypothetical protein
MLTPAASLSLYRIDECRDLMADACLCDDPRHLVFASLWGRDTAVQEFLGRLTLGSQEDGLDGFHLIDDDEQSFHISAQNPDRFVKRTTRAYRRTLFGSMVHVWIFDRRCVKPDKANASALAILPKDETTRIRRLWSVVQETCPLPLLDHWRDIVLDLLREKSMLSTLPFALGSLEGHRLALNVPLLTTELGELIRNETLIISPTQSALREPLRRVA